MRVDPRLWGVGWALVLGAAPAAAEPIAMTSDSTEVVIKDKGKPERLARLGEGELVSFTVQGPLVLELTLRAIGKKAAKGGGQGTLLVLRDERWATRWPFTLATGKPVAMLKPSKGQASVATVRQLSVPAGSHRLVVSVSDAAGQLFALGLTVAAKARPELALPAEVDQAPPSVEPPPAAPPPPVAVPAEVVETPAVKVAAETRAESLGVVTAAEERPAPAAGPTETLSVAAADGSVQGATRALADAVAQGFAKVNPGAPFYRVAVPYFQELGEGPAQHHLGRLVAELLAGELAARAPFVLVERERLDQVMREHRLAGLGIVDEKSAAEFGKVLGAQSLISGTVAEAGPSYVVTVRQVETESGRVLVAGDVSIAREGLIALSADAVVLRSKSGAAFRSALVPGWGQLYNREPVKGIAFLAAGVAALGSAGGFYAAALSARSEYEKNRPGTVKYRDIANERIDVVNISLIVYGAVWAINLVDAYLSGADSTAVELPAGGAGVAVRF